MITLRVVLGDTDSALDLQFSALSTAAEIFSALLERTKKPQGPPLQLYLRMKDGRYTPVELGAVSTTSLRWESYDFDSKNRMYLGRLANSSPPERPSVSPADLDAKALSVLLYELSQPVPAYLLDVSARTGVHFSMEPEPVPLEGMLVELGQHFPLVGLDDIGSQLLSLALRSWKLYRPKAVEGARCALVVLAGGPSGTGKTRFGAEMPAC
jgi:hypothetical protein